MTSCCLLLLTLVGAGNEQVIDAFEHADSASAAKGWIASDGTPPVRVVEDGGRRVLEMAAPFASKPDLPRTVIDRKVELDLSAPGELTLEIAGPATYLGDVLLNLRSGHGWYYRGAPLSKKGWQTLRFPKVSFGGEAGLPLGFAQDGGAPKGWHRIEAIRISILPERNEPPIDALVRFARLSVVSHDVALVIPSAEPHPTDREVGAAQWGADAVGEVLRRLGVGFDVLDEKDVARGMLQRYHVAVLANYPRMVADAYAALERFVAGGGKVFTCFALPPELGKALGFGDWKYLAAQPADQFAEIRFDAPDIPGLPKSVRQNSWNIMTAQPIGHNARVIGRWFDARGETQKWEAMLVSDRGAYFSHIVLSDDPEGKCRVLAAVFGYLHPPLWKEILQHKLERLFHVGHVESSKDLVRYVSQSSNAVAQERITAASKVYREALARQASGDYPQAVELVRQTRQLVVEAYLRAAPSRHGEGRAFWSDNMGMGAYPGDWDRTAKELALAGFNMLIPMMFGAGVAHYESDILPRSKTFAERGDQIAQCVAACKKHGLESHIWKFNWTLGYATPEFIEKMRQQGRTQVSSAGKPIHWLCPSNPENFKVERDSMLEVARKYDVAGLHFDHIRYPDDDSCYCEGCRSRFESESGVKVANWPHDCHRGVRGREYRDWRCKQITRLVEAVHREAKKIRPGIKFSAAVCSHRSWSEKLGQDWVGWIKAGYLDFVCPMNYIDSDLRFIAVVSDELQWIKGRTPVYPGIGTTAERYGLSVDRVVGQIHYARLLGANGFVIHHLDPTTVQRIVPGVGLGAGAQPAVPPHRK